MARAPVSSTAEVAAAIARMEEQITTLQRERREDKAEMREEVKRLETVFTDEIKGLKTDLAAQLAPIRKELEPLTRLRWQGLGLVVALALLFGFVGHRFGDPVLKMFGQN